jgi:hypothetical protein
MTPEDLAAVEKLTAELNEFTAICGRIRADLDLLSAIAEDEKNEAFCAAIAAAETANDGVAK